MPKSIYKFCPRCGDKLQWRHEYKNKTHEPRRQICPSCKHVLYDASSPTAGALIVNTSDEVLLIKREFNPFKGFWQLPGGFIDGSESPEEATKRETKEEVGVTIKIIGYIGTYPDIYRFNNRMIKTLNTFYLAKITRGTPKLLDGVADLRWYGRKKLPKHIAFSNNRRALKAWQHNKVLLLKK